MNTVGVMDVYRKIKEINSKGIDDIRSVSIDNLAQELNGSKEIIQEYVAALTILELVKPSETGDMVITS